jgi:hypothetical protein
MVLWPRISCTSFRLAPCMIIWLAKVCRRSWNLKSKIPASFNSPLKNEKTRHCERSEAISRLMNSIS